MDQKIVGFNQFGAVIRKVKAWVESTFLTLSKDSADQSIAGVRSVSDIIKLAKGASSAAPLTKITYAELKALRDGAKLVPGMQYRITDYTCTTTQTDTQSAGHVFDVIVTADDERVLNTKARAIHHEGDTYFTKSNLAKWQIWYDLDNAKTKYNWVDETNGKGVIYRMIDEYGNDCPYDFKNIQFKRYKVTSSILAINNKYVGPNTQRTEEYTINSNDFKWYYTFSYEDSDSSIKDTYISTQKRFLDKTGSNTMGIHQINFVLILPNNVFIDVADTRRNAIYPSSLNSLGTSCINNTFLDRSSQNTLKKSCNSNIFTGQSFFNSFGNGCSSNSFGNGCSGNSFGNGCNGNSFGNNCSGNSFGNGCGSNSFGNGCDNNSFGNGCNGNSFGNNCSGNSFGNGCNLNKFGLNCSSNTFGTNCINNVFGDNYRLITFGNGCIFNIFGEGSDSPINNVKCVDIASDVAAIKVKTTIPTNDLKYLQNISISKGIHGETDNPANIVYKEITVDVLGQDYEITYTKAADGTLVKQIAQA